MIRRFTSARWLPHQRGQRARTLWVQVITARRALRRALAISLAVRRDTGHAHPHRDLVRASDAGVRGATGKSKADLATAFATLWRELGLDREGNRFGRCGSLLAY